jgi:multidrug efflux pump subunit AcrA (membrane-fusion protein)
VSGIVRRVLVSAGDRLAVGRPLAAVECPDLGGARAALRKAQANFIAAEHDFRRMTELHGLGELTAREYEQAEDDYRHARSAYLSARAKYERLRRMREPDEDESDDFVVRAPVDGVVAARLVEPNDVVAGQYEDGGTELFRIAVEP